MTQRESRLSSKIREKLTEMGVFSFKVWGNEHMMAGLPDIIACVDGVFLGLETKMPGKRDNTSPRQRYVHGLILNSGGAVHVVCSVHEVQSIVNDIRQNLAALARHAQGD